MIGEADIFLGLSPICAFSRLPYSACGTRPLLKVVFPVIAGAGAGGSVYAPAFLVARCVVGLRFGQDHSATVRLLDRENVDQEALMAYARQAADFSTDLQLPHLDYAVNHYGQSDVAMFDFTSMYAAENASRVVEKSHHRLLMGLVGDSLLEVGISGLPCFLIMSHICIMVLHSQFWYAMLVNGYLLRLMFIFRLLLQMKQISLFIRAICPSGQEFTCVTNGSPG